MKFMGTNELREAYLKFFESKDHLRLESFPLVPKSDRSLLLINAVWHLLNHILLDYRSRQEKE